MKEQLQVSTTYLKVQCLVTKFRYTFSSGWLLSFTVSRGAALGAP